MRILKFMKKRFLRYSHASLKSKRGLGEDAEVDPLFLFNNNEELLKEAEKIFAHLKYKPRKLVKRKIILNSVSNMFNTWPLYFDLKDYFSNHIIGTVSLLHCLKNIDTREDQIKFNAYLDMLFIYIFNFNEYLLQFFNHFFALKLAETRKQRDQIKKERNSLKERISELEQKKEQADNETSFKIDNLIKIAELKNQDIKELNLSNFEQRLEEIYVIDPLLKK